MVTPTKGDYQAVPMNAEARKVADAWDPAADEAAGEPVPVIWCSQRSCVFPDALHITWQDDRPCVSTSDTGTQTRLFHFDSSTGEASVAGQFGGTVGDAAGRARGGGGARRRPAPPVKGGSLKVVTKNLRAGYLRKNGVPYSENADLTEYFDHRSPA